MLVIGLTGGIGTGKSTVAGILRDLGAQIIDADKVGHEVLAKTSPVFPDLVRAFGEQIIGANGEIDRSKLGKIVFGDEPSMQKLNGITHPAMKSLVRQKLAEFKKQKVEIVVVDSPLLVAGGWLDLADNVWLTVAPLPTILERVRKRSNLSEEMTRARMAAQLSETEQRRHADVVIDTDRPLDDLHREVKRALDALRERDKKQAFPG